MELPAANPQTSLLARRQPQTGKECLPDFPATFEKKFHLRRIEAVFMIPMQISLFDGNRMEVEP
ncbi:hypothetical protein [Rhizobium leguminosarum]|uniref:hypothetical protein n=1 Tax=Rhizobium leguminosarum TaxID=384 RepID=UPI003F945BA1